MTFEELIDEYGTRAEFYLDELGDVRLFADKVEKAVDDFLARDLSLVRGNVTKTAKNVGAFKSQLSDTIESIWLRGQYWYSQNINPTRVLENTISSTEFWKGFIEVSDYKVELEANIDIKKYALILQNNLYTMNDRNLGDFRSVSIQRDNRLDLSNTSIEFIVGDLVNFFKNNIRRFSLSLYGNIKSIDTKIVEDLQHSSVGDWKDLPPMPEREATLKQLEENLKSLVESGDYHSYSINDLGTFTRVETTPFKTEPFETQFAIKNTI